MNGVSRHARDSALLPLRKDRRLALELRLVVGPDREDAVQEAWVALLEGRDPARAVNTFARRERRYRRRALTSAASLN